MTHPIRNPPAITSSLSSILHPNKDRSIVNKMNEPLAARIRPKTLDEFVGQEHLVGQGKPLRLAIKNKQRLSFILWGPPGSGKTTLARIYAAALQTPLVEISAVSAGKDDMRAAVAHPGTVLLIDEIHRFNKAQQDYLLPYVEDGTILLIGATTENPSFEIISPLLSRCRIFVLNELSAVEMSKIIDRTKIKVDKKPKIGWLLWPMATLAKP